MAPPNSRPDRQLGDHATASASPVPAASDRPLSPPRALPGTLTPTLNSGTGQHGEPVYDQASIARIESRPGVTTQSFGGSAQGTGAEERVSPQFTRTLPGVASTFGLSVTDPRLQDRPVRTLDVGFRGADATAEAYNSREDRESRQKLLSDISSRLSQLQPNSRGNRQLIASLLQTQADLTGGGEKLAADAIAGRNNNASRLANTGLEQAGQDRRTQFTAQSDTANATADRALRRDTARSSDATKRAEIAAGQTPRPEYRLQHDGTLLTVTGNKAERVLDGDGKPVRLPVQDPSSLTGNDLLKAYGDQRNAIAGLADSLSPEEVNAQLKALDESALGKRYLSALTSGTASPGTPSSGADKVPAAPKVGETLMGYRYLGGALDDPKSWAPVQ